MALRLLVLALAACVVSLTSTAQAGPKEEAEQHFRAGVSLQKVEDFEAAILAFEASLRLFPTKSALFNLANCYKATHRYVDALNTLERLQRDYGSELQEPMLGAAASLTEELEGLTAWLSVEVDRPGAEIFVDGAPVGKSPLPVRIRVEVGQHELRVSLEGYQIESRSVRLASREAATERFELSPLAEPEPAAAPVAPAPVTDVPEPAPATPAAVPVRDSSGGDARSFAWATTGAGALLLLGGAVTGTWALVEDGNLSGACEDERCPADRSDQIDRLNTLTTTTNVLLGAGALVTAAGVVLLLVSGDASPAGAKDAASEPNLDVAVAPGYVGVNARYGF